MSPIPAAVAAIVAAVVADNPLSPPEAVGRLVVDALADEGWRITPEPLSAPQRAAGAPCRPKRRTRPRTPATR